MESLWGEEFSVQDTSKKTEKILKKLSEPKKP